MKSPLCYLLLLSTLAVFSGCATHGTPPQAAANRPASGFPCPLALCADYNYMPQWTDTDFAEAAGCGIGILPAPGYTYYRKAVIAARKHDRHALEQVIECSYSTHCDAMAGELHSGVLLQLMLAWGDIDFSHALASVIARHQQHFPITVLVEKPLLERYFPLSYKVVYGS